MVVSKQQKTYLEAPKIHICYSDIILYQPIFLGVFFIVNLNYLDKFLFVSAIALDLVPLLTVYWQLKRIDFSNSFAALANSR